MLLVISCAARKCFFLSVYALSERQDLGFGQGHQIPCKHGVYEEPRPKALWHEKSSLIEWLKIGWVLPIRSSCVRPIDNMSHRNYQELCTDPSQSPLGPPGEAGFLQKVARIYAHWDTGANAKTSSELAEDLVANLDTCLNGGLAVMVWSDATPGGVLRILHGFAKSLTSSFYLWTFAHLRDIQGAHIKTVELDLALLETTVETCIQGDPQAQLQH